MISAEHVNREPPTAIGVLWLVTLLAIYFASGHIPWTWERVSEWLFGYWGPPMALPPYPFMPH